MKPGRRQRRATARRAAQTRWLYRAEDTVFRHNRHAVAERPVAALRRLAVRVWREQARAGRAVPSVTASAGCRSGGRFTSYCLGFSEIVLARHHRNLLVLLHELTHALGPCTHGPKFVRLYFRLLQRYGGYNRWFLQGIAAARGISL